MIFQRCSAAVNSQTSESWQKGLNQLPTLYDHNPSSITAHSLNSNASLPSNRSNQMYPLQQNWIYEVHISINITISFVFVLLGENRLYTRRSSYKLTRINSTSCFYVQTSGRFIVLQSLSVSVLSSFFELRNLSL